VVCAGRRLRRPVALPPVLEPVADLREGQSSLPGKRALLVGRRVAILRVALLQGVARALLEAVHCLFAVPYRLWQREFLAQPVFVHGAKRPSSNLQTHTATHK